MASILESMIFVLAGNSNYSSGSFHAQIDQFFKFNKMYSVFCWSINFATFYTISNGKTSIMACQYAGPPLGLLQDGCPRLFAGRGGTFQTVPGTHYSKLTIFIVMGIMILGCMENYFFASIHHLVTTLLWQVLNAPFLISEGVPGSWHISGRVPGTRCSKSMGAYAPVAPVLTEALLSYTSLQIPESLMSDFTVHQSLRYPRELYRQKRYLLICYTSK